MSAWSDSDLIAAGYDPRSGKRFAPISPSPASPSSLAGRGGERESQPPADSENASAAVTGACRPAVNVVLGRSGPARNGDAGVPRQLSSYARSRLQPEQLLQVQVIEQLRPKLVAGAKLISLCGEIPEGSRLGELAQSVRNAMGYEAGTPDLEALYRGRTCFIELKRPRGEADLLGRRKARGELSAVQRTWRDWCHDQGYGWTVARSVDEVETTLAKWGMI